MAYAKGTKVEVDKTQAEIRSFLRRHGVTRYSLEDADEGGMIRFELRSRAYGFAIAHPMQEPKENRVRWWNQNRVATLNEQAEEEWRRRWRARLMWLKMALEFAESEGEEAGDEALAGYLLLRDGRTVAQTVAAGGMQMLGAG